MYRRGARHAPRARDACAPDDCGDRTGARCNARCDHRRRQPQRNRLREQRNRRLRCRLFRHLSMFALAYEVENTWCSPEPLLDWLLHGPQFWRKLHQLTTLFNCWLPSNGCFPSNYINLWLHSAILSLHHSMITIFAQWLQADICYCIYQLYILLF